MYKMYKVTIYKDKITFTVWNEANEDFYEVDIKDSGPITKHFDKIVEIHKDVTVEDFMNHLAFYEKDIDFCFAGYTDGIPLKIFLNEMALDIETELNIKEVQLFWFGEILDENLIINGSLRSYLSKRTAQEKGLDSDEPYGLEYISINNWKKGKLILNENIVIVDYGSPLEEIASDENDHPVFDGFMGWTFHQVISSFLLCITQHGTPEERDAAIDFIESKKLDVNTVGQNRNQAELWRRCLVEDIESTKNKMEAAAEDSKYEEAARLKTTLELLKGELLALDAELNSHKNIKMPEGPEVRSGQ